MKGKCSTKFRGCKNARHENAALLCRAEKCEKGIWGTISEVVEMLVKTEYGQPFVVKYQDPHKIRSRRQYITPLHSTGHGQVTVRRRFSLSFVFTVAARHRYWASISRGRGNEQLPWPTYINNWKKVYVRYTIFSFLSERCNCTAKFRYNHKMLSLCLSVVWDASVLWQNNCK